MPVNLAEGTTVSTVAVLEPGLVRRDGDLEVAILRFNYEIDGVRQTFDGVLGESVTDDAWNYVYLDYDGSLNVNTTGFPTTTHVRLARVRADNGLITTIQDERVILAAGINANPKANKSEGQDSDTIGSWVQKVRLDLPNMEEGTYKIYWYCELRHSNNTLSEYAEMKIEIDDTFEIGQSIWPYNGFEDAAGFNSYDISAGSHFIDIDFRVQGGGTAYIRRARMYVERTA